MKKLFVFIVAVFLAANAFAQSPQKMSYQAVIRDVSNNLVTSHAVGMRVSILQGSVTGTEVYKEIYNPNPETNVNGLIAINIGAGIPLSGAFSAINWANGPFFIKIETDPTGGTNYSITGTSELMSVPYALFSLNGTPGPQGPKGDTGAKGIDGATPTIGVDGYWYINGVKTTTKAEGTDGICPAITIGTDYYWYINGVNTGVKAKGETGATGSNGATPIIGVDGYWYINGVKTTTMAKGENGATGAKGDKGDTGATGPQGPAGPAVSTSAVCVSASSYWDVSSQRDIYSPGSCSCSGTTVSRVSSPCTITSNTGTCSAKDGGIYHGECCICRP